MTYNSDGGPLLRCRPVPGIFWVVFPVVFNIFDSLSFLILWQRALSVPREVMLHRWGYTVSIETVR